MKLFRLHREIDLGFCFNRRKNYLKLVRFFNFPWVNNLLLIRHLMTFSIKLINKMNFLALLKNESCDRRELVISKSLFPKISNFYFKLSVDNMCKVNFLHRLVFQLISSCVQKASEYCDR